jgi:hypothetical protein
MGNAGMTPNNFQQKPGMAHRVRRDPGAVKGALLGAAAGGTIGALG